jgi:hypothetical protein
VNHKLYLGVPAPSSLGGSPASQGPSGWSSNDSFVRGTWRPPSFMDKLLSGKRYQGDQGLGGVLVAKPSSRVEKSLGRDLVTGK